MSKSKLNRLLIQGHRLPKDPSGFTSSLKWRDTTMWTSKDTLCPHIPSHIITMSPNRFYCHECGMYWDKDYTGYHQA